MGGEQPLQETHGMLRECPRPPPVTHPQPLTCSSRLEMICTQPRCKSCLVNVLEMWLTLSINSHFRRLHAAFLDLRIGAMELHVPETMTRERSGASGLQRPDRRLRAGGAQCGTRRLDGIPSSILVGGCRTACLQAKKKADAWHVHALLQLAPRRPAALGCVPGDAG